MEGKELGNHRQGERVSKGSSKSSVETNVKGLKFKTASVLVIRVISSRQERPIAFLKHLLSRLYHSLEESTPLWARSKLNVPELGGLKDELQQ